jgi:hypothetical protein
MTEKATLWLLPIGFVVHDGEELLTMANWVAQHRQELDELARHGPLVQRVVASIPATQSEVTLAIALELVGLTAVTALATRDIRNRAWLYVYAVLLAVFVLHGGTHVLLAAVFGGYVPGLISAVTVVPAVGYATYRRLLGNRCLTPRTAIVAALIGAVAFLPFLILLVRLVRSVA